MSLPEQRVALIMGGGVSLGAFSAGALARLLQLLPQFAGGPARIDVMTGASAGSMTLAIVLNRLMRGATTEETVASLYDAWVKEVGIEQLCAERSDDEACLLDRRIIETVAGRHAPAAGWTGAEASGLLADEVLVSFALTNLNGVPARAEGQMLEQGYAPRGGDARRSPYADALQTTFHHDVIRFVAHTRGGQNGAPDSRLPRRVLLPQDAASAEWKVFRDAAIASGAFPLAFPPVRLARNRGEYAEVDWPHEGIDAFTYDYADGGILRNEPLREAIHLSAILDDGADHQRLFVLIDPNISGTNEVYPLPYNRALLLKKGRLHAPGYVERTAGVALRLIATLASQATYRDWLQARRVNSQVEWRERIERVIDSLPLPGVETIEALSRELLMLYEEKKARNPRAAWDPVQRYQRDLGRVARPGRSPFAAQLLMLVDQVSNLQDKKQLRMVAVTPVSATAKSRAGTLAGSFLMGFGGFFDERYRRHDFIFGEGVAYDVLTAEAPERFVDPTLVPAPADPPTLEGTPAYPSVPTAAAGVFEDTAARHVRAAVRAAGHAWAARLIPRRWLTGRVRRALSGPTPPAAFVLEIGEAHGHVLGGSSRGNVIFSDSSGRLRTVVTVSDGTFGGPSAVRRNGMQEVQVWRRGSRSSAPVAVLSLAGSDAEWRERISRCSVAEVRLRLGELVSGQVVGPEDLS